MGFENYHGTETCRESCAIGSIIGRERDKWYIYRNYVINESYAPLCKCGCGKQVKREKLYPYEWNEYVYQHHTPKDRLTNWHKKMKKENPKKYYELLSEGAKKWHKEFKKKDPEGYKKFQAKGMETFHDKNPNFASENSKRIHKIIPDLGSRCFNGRLKNMPWKFMGISFPSKTEKEVAKMRFEILGIIPINKVNCHIMITNKEFDFEQFGFVQEHHPNAQPLYKSIPQEEYYEQRRKILDSNGHKKSELIITENEKEAKQLYEWLKDKLGVVV